VLARALVVEPHAADIKAELADMGIADEALLDRYMLRGILGGEDAKPREPGLFGRLAAALSLRKARASARAGDWPAAETHYRTLLRHAPDRINARVQLGHALLEQGRPAEAVTAYRRALLSSPREAEIHLHVGHALKNLDRRDSAFESYLTAWRLKPSFALALEELAALRTDRDMQSLLSEEEGVRGGFRATADPDPKALRSPTLLTEPSWLNDRQKLAFRFLAGSLAYKD
jgi:Tfp pilus assembly protein PilF